MFKTLAQKYRYSTILLKQLVVTDFKLRYQGSFLGYLWSLLKPLALFGILDIIFVRFMKFGGNIPHFSVYLLLGIVVWNYFAEVTVGGVGAIVGRGDLLRKINFPKYVIVLAGSFSALINLAINLVVVFVFMVFAGAQPDLWAIVGVPILIVELFTFSIAVAFFLSALYVKFRDLNYIWEVFMQAAFYATPILYPLSSVGKVAPWLTLNPVAQIMQDMRHLLITPKSETISMAFGNHWVRLVPVGLTVFAVLLAGWYFKKQSKHFAEEV